MKQPLKKHSFLSTWVLLPSLFSVALISFLLAVWFVYREKEIEVDNINNAIQFTSLLLTIGTIFFVVKTYIIQKEELDENKNVTQFNRALDIIYKQLEYSKNIFLVNADEVERIRKFTFTSKIIVNNANVLTIVFIKVKYELSLIQRLFNNSILERDDKEYFYKIFTSNIPYDFKILIGKVIKYLNTVNNFEELFEQELIDYYRDIIFNSVENSYELLEEDEITSDMVKNMYSSQIESKLIELNLLKSSSETIDRFFIDNNIWLNSEIN